MIRLVYGAAALALMVGCTVDPGGAYDLRTPDRATFPLEAGPILAKRCADFSCHGNDIQPFGLYAVGRRRLRAAERFTSKPLTEDELDANYNATLGFLDAVEPRDTTLLKKALGLGGKGAHKGDAVFADRSDPECRALEAWIKGEEMWW